MRKKELFWIVLAVCAVFTSCYEDKGNYNYHEINEISIAELPESFSLLYGETIDIYPEITVTMPGVDPDTFEYKWYKLGDKNGPLFEVAEGRDLEDWLPPFSSGKNSIVLYVRDPATGQRAISSIVTITTENTIGKGFAILSEHDNVGQFDYLTLFREKWLHVKATDLPELTDPIGVWGYSDKNSPIFNAVDYGIASADQFCLLVGTKQKLYRLYTKDLTYYPEYDYYKMVLGREDPDFSVANVIHSPNAHESIMVSHEGNVYYYSAGTTVWRTIISDTYINCDVNGNLFPVSPFMENYGSDRMRIFFRTDTRSFVFHSQSANYCSAFTDAQTDEVVLNNTGRDLLWLGGRQREGVGVVGKSYAVMKDAADESKRFIISFLQNGNSTRMEEDISHLTDIHSAVGYEIPRHENMNTNSLIYYHTDTKLYVYNMEYRLNNLVYTAPAGKIITWLGRAGTKYMNPSNYWDDNLILCTYDPADPVGSGTMELLKINDLSGKLIPATNGDGGEEMVFTGFNKIIGVAWKDK